MNTDVFRAAYRSKRIVFMQKAPDYAKFGIISKSARAKARCTNRIKIAYASIAQTALASKAMGLRQEHPKKTKETDRDNCVE